MNQYRRRKLDKPNEDAVRQVRLRAYARARRYWQAAGDAERLALTDAELDEQFWLIDYEGVPRLKSEQGTIDIPPDSLLRLGEIADQADFRSGQTDISGRSREILNTEFVDYLINRRIRGRTDGAE